MLRNWDFRDPEANETLSQINRQKSAMNLLVASLDRDRRTGQFLDPKKGILVTASLERCECRDFGFAGNSARKSFRPCMHIYRLAMELGLMDVRFADHAARRAEDRDRIAEQRDIETARLRALPRDPKRWGRWHAAVHESGLQRNRQYRAYHLIEETPRGDRGAGTRLDRARVPREPRGVRVHGLRRAPAALQPHVRAGPTPPGAAAAHPERVPVRPGRGQGPRVRVPARGRVSAPVAADR